MIKESKLTHFIFLVVQHLLNDSAFKLHSLLGANRREQAKTFGILSFCYKALTVALRLFGCDHSFVKKPSEQLLAHYFHDHPRHLVAYCVSLERLALSDRIYEVFGWSHHSVHFVKDVENLRLLKEPFVSFDSDFFDWAVSLVEILFPHFENHGKAALSIQKHDSSALQTGKHFLDAFETAQCKIDLAVEFEGETRYPKRSYWEKSKVVALRFLEQWAQNINARHWVLRWEIFAELLQHKHRNNDLGLSFSHIQLGNAAQALRFEVLISVVLWLPDPDFHFRFEANPIILFVYLFSRTLELPKKRCFVDYGLLQQMYDALEALYLKS